MKRAAFLDFALSRRTKNDPHSPFSTSGPVRVASGRQQQHARERAGKRSERPDRGRPPRRATAEVPRERRRLPGDAACELAGPLIGFRFVSQKVRFVATSFPSCPALRDGKKGPFSRCRLSFCQSRAVAAPKTRFFGTSLRGSARATPHRASPCAASSLL